MIQQKTFIYRGKIQQRITKEELGSFDKNINKFLIENEGILTDTKLCVAFDHIFLLTTVLFNIEKEKASPSTPEKERE